MGLGKADEGPRYRAACQIERCRCTEVGKFRHNSFDEIATHWWTRLSKDAQRDNRRTAFFQICSITHIAGRLIGARAE